MNRFRLAILSCAIIFAGISHAEIYKRVDKDGRVTYSSTPLKGGKKLELEPLPTMEAQRVPKTRNNDSDFRVDGATQARRDDKRRTILEDELATEQKALDDARANLQQVQDTPEVYKNANGQTFRNVAKYQANVSAAQDDVTAHESNVKALKTELSHLK